MPYTPRARHSLPIRDVFSKIAEALKAIEEMDGVKFQAVLMVFGSSLQPRMPSIIISHGVMMQ